MMPKHSGGEPDADLSMENSPEKEDDFGIQGVHVDEQERRTAGPAFGLH